MRIKCSFCFLAGFMFLASGVAAQAQPSDTDPVAFVTMVTGHGATRGVSGPKFSKDTFSEDENGVAPGQSVVTLAGGTASVTLPAHGTFVRLDASSELMVGRWNALENDVPVTLTLVKGRAYILRRHVDGWLVVAAESDVGSGHALSKSRAMLVTSDEGGVGFTVLDGVATWFVGSIPGDRLLDEAGEPLNKEAGKVVQAGQRISTDMQMEEVPDHVMRTVQGETVRDLYAVGVEKAASWVKDAETGDLTPVRAAARTEAQLGRAQVSSELAFDQPRTVVTTTSPRTLEQPLRTSARNPVRSLLESGLPSNVVVGQRIRRTTIIGSSGPDGGPIRVNPNVQPLLRLTGSSN